MPQPFVRKLRYGAQLSLADEAVLIGAVVRETNVKKQHDLIREGTGPSEVHVMLEGFSARYKVLRDGTRQIMAFLVPGDMCDIHVAMLGAMDHGIVAVSDCRIGHLPRETIVHLTANYSQINKALWWATLVDEATLREWLVNIGRRPADRQMAHLFCELLARLRAVGLAGINGFSLPVTQEVLADALGMSPVHASRVLRELRDAGLVAFSGGIVTIPDVARLHAFAEFDIAYLHLNRRQVASGPTLDAA